MSEKVKSIEVCIESDEVVKRYTITDAIEIVRCRTAIFFHSTCFWQVVRPTMANNGMGGALFEMLTWYCDYQDTRDDFDDETKTRNDTLCALIVNILTLPLDIFTDMDFCLDISDYILTKRNEYYERLKAEASVEKEETIEDALKNVEFEAAVAVEESLKEEISGIVEKQRKKKK